MLLINSINNIASGDIRDAISGAANEDVIYLQEEIYRGINNIGLSIDKNLISVRNGSRANVVIGVQNIRQIFTLEPGINVDFINLTFLKGNASGNGEAVYNIYTNTSIKIINSDSNNNRKYGGTIYNIGFNISINDFNFTNKIGGS